MDVEIVWRHIHEQRRALASILATLDADEWRTPSLCPGWSAKDVAAHVISSPQHSWGGFLVAMVRGRFDLNRTILVDGQRRGRAPVAEILAQFEQHDGSRSVPPTTTPLEPLIDVLVHTQDLLRPLGREHAMPPDAAATAADRASTQAEIFGNPPLDKVRLVATDIDWARGGGPTVEAPMQELLMLVTGRAADAALVEGDGRGLVRLA